MSSLVFMEPTCLLRKARNATVMLTIAITEPFIAPFFTMIKRCNDLQKIFFAKKNMPLQLEE